jgi:CRP-like cAMP-binding protein
MAKSSWNYRSVIFKEGEEAQKLYLVKSGEVICLKASKDRLIPIFIAREGDIIGEAAMTPGAPYSYSTICLDSSELHEISAISFTQVFNQAPEWVSQLMTTMISRFQSTSVLIAENRVIDSSIISEDFYSPLIENDFKKLLSNKTE